MIFSQCFISKCLVALKMLMPDSIEMLEDATVERVVRKT